VILTPIAKQVQLCEKNSIETVYLSTYNFIKDPVEFHNETNRWFYDFDALTKIINSIN